jgi:hypothetical protein
MKLGSELLKTLVKRVDRDVLRRRGRLMVWSQAAYVLQKSPCLRAAEPVMERRHPIPLAVEDAGQELNVSAPPLPGGAGEVGDFRIVAAETAAATIVAVAGGTIPLIKRRAGARRGLVRGRWCERRQDSQQSKRAGASGPSREYDP